MKDVTQQLADALAQEPWPAKVRLGDHLFQNSYDDGSYYCYELRASIKFADRAALSAIPARDDALEGLLAKALRRLAYWAQTSGGTAGRDDGLVAAIDVGLAALRQYDTKLAAPAQEPR